MVQNCNSSRLKETEKCRGKDGRPYISNYKWYTGSGNSWELKIIDTHTSIASMRHTVCMCDMRRHALRMYERGRKGPLLSCWHRLSGTGRGRVMPGGKFWSRCQFLFQCIAVPREEDGEIDYPFLGWSPERGHHNRGFCFIVQGCQWCHLTTGRRIFL